MSNGGSRPFVSSLTNRDFAPRTHALRDAVIEAQWGDGYDDELRDTFRRIDNILLWMCWNAEEVSQDVEEFVVRLLWVSALARERAA